MRNSSALNSAGEPAAISPQGAKWLSVAAIILLALTAVRGDDLTITVRADQVVGQVSRYLTGACIEDVNHEIYGGIYSQMIFGESFQEPPPAPIIKGFRAYGGQWLIGGRETRIAGLDGPKLVSEHAAFADGAAGVELFFADRTGQNAGLILRASDPGVGADRFVGYEVALDPGRQVLRLARHRNNFEPIRDVPCDVPIGRWVALEARLAGRIVEILVDGRSVLRHDDGGNALPAGTVGLRAWHREVSFRNLWVKAGDRTEQLPLEQVQDQPQVSGMWRAIHRGSAAGKIALVSERPFVGTQSQYMRFDAGDGEWGLENQGLNRWGLNFFAGRSYDGAVWVRAQEPTALFVALESRDGSRVYAETRLPVGGGDWQRLDFTLTPTAADTAGRFALKLKRPGAVTLGYASLQPGEWGRFKGLPVRRDVAEALIDQGITVLRYGGSMVNNSGYNWKNMIGPRDRRPPYAGTWYRYSSNGWGIADFMDLCEAAGFEYIPAFNMGQTPQEMAEFIEYAKGSASSEWGRRRAADGHGAPYRLKYIELGNEERVDDGYFARFKPLAEAIWDKDRDVVLVVGDFAYGRRIQDPFNFAGAASRITSLDAHRRILQLARQHNREVWFDVHVNTERPERFNSSLDGMFSFADALEKIADGAKHKVAVFELNAGNHAQRRALANALAINAIERDGRIPIVTSANCLQPDGQNDNGWDQGLLFLNPSRSWLQPPGYVTQMLSRAYLPQRVRCDLAGAEGALDVNATRSQDGKLLLLQVVNPGNQALKTRIRLAGFSPANPVARVQELSGPLDAVNSAGRTDAIAPRQSEWRHELTDGGTTYVFPPYSLSLLRFE